MIGQNLVDTNVPSKLRIAVLVLNGATGETRELVANVTARDEQEAVEMLFAKARRDDFYYRFLGQNTEIRPINANAVPLEYNAHVWWALE